MKKLLVVILVFCVTACNAIPSTDSPADSAPAIPEITQTPSLNPFLYVTNTPTVFTTATLTPVPPTLTPTPPSPPPPQKEIPVFPPTLIIPTLQAGMQVKLDSIRMIDTQIGWAIYLESREALRPGFQGDPYLWPPEGYILRTADGGKTWQNVTPPTGAYSPGGFFALDANTAWASDNTLCCTHLTINRLWRTTDGGRTWQASQPFSIEHVKPSEFYLPVQIQFIDQNTGWLLSSSEAGMDYSLRGNLLHTTDGGHTWTNINYDLGSCWNGGLAFINSTTGWYGTSCVSGGKTMVPFSIFFEEGGWKVSHTTDGGNSFTLSTLIPTPPDLQKLETTNPEMDCGETKVIAFTPLVVGIEWECRNYINYDRYKYFSLSTDEGHTWNSWIPSGNEYFLDAGHGWRLLSPGQLQQTSDRGLNWTTIKKVAWVNAQFDFVSERIGWAIASNGQTTALVLTTDGGKTWTEIKPVIAR